MEYQDLLNQLGLGTEPTQPMMSMAPPPAPPQVMSTPLNAPLNAPLPQASVPQAPPMSFMKPQPAPAPMSDDAPDIPAKPDPLAKAGDNPLSKYMVTQDDLDKAHKARDTDILVGGIGDALANRQSFGNFFLGKMNPHQDVSGTMNDLAKTEDQAIKDKQTMLKQVLEAPKNKMMMDLQDPNSTPSIMVKTATISAIQSSTNWSDDQKAEMIAGIKKGSGYEAQQLIENTPLLKEEITANSADRKTAAMLARIGAMNAKAGQGDTRKDNTDWEKFATAINNPSARNAIGRYQTNVDKAQTINVLSRQIGMPPGQEAPADETKEQRIVRFNKADSRQLYEFAKASDQLTSNTASTIYGTDHMMPKDMDIAEAKLREYAPIWAGGGKPADANAGAYIDRYLDSANREGSYFQSRRDRAVKGISAGYSHLQAKDPSRWNDVLASMSDQSPGSPQNPPQGGGQIGGPQAPQDPKIAKYATDNGLDYAHAQTILTGRGYKPNGQ